MRGNIGAETLNHSLKTALLVRSRSEMEPRQSGEYSVNAEWLTPDQRGFYWSGRTYRQTFLWYYWWGHQLALSTPDISSCLSFCRYGYLFLGLEIWGPVSWIVLWWTTPYKGFIRWGAQPKLMRKEVRDSRARKKEPKTRDALWLKVALIKVSVCCVVLWAQRRWNSLGRSHLWGWSRVLEGKLGMGWLHVCSIVYCFRKIRVSFLIWAERGVVAWQGSSEGCDFAQSF